ncbi:MAG: class I poly(R)-hydroxyalkanoic acid synthase [Burkholderiales bacterium]|nr:class I poly(R)-hydroxyalkanoic acid synthase [Burkholderiales bacterium]
MAVTSRPRQARAAASSARSTASAGAAAPSRSRGKAGAASSRPSAGAAASVASVASVAAGAAAAAGAAPQPDAAALSPAAQAFGSSVGLTLQSLASLSLPSDALEQLRADYLEQARQLWNRCMDPSTGTPPSLDDRRFAAPQWGASPLAAFQAGLYLLNARTLVRLADALQGDDKQRQRVRFAVQQLIDAASPSNYLALNPEALARAVETKGESLRAGLQMLMRDLQQGRVSQTDETVFEVGRNVATTEGAVVFENELIQLIEYRPLTEQVHERPILFVPPCINKYYILDLQPENSLVRHAVEQGHRVFVVSWVNPDDSLAAKTWDDYVQHGVIQAIDVVRDIAGQRQVNALGFCVGGTLLATAAAVMKARGDDALASLTLLTSFLDFSRTGVLDIFVDEASVQLREATIGPGAPGGPKLLKGQELATTFSFLRPNDLVWNYVVGNYLKGETPPAFDLLYWNGDSTNLPGPMYCWYLRHTYLQNELIQPGRLSVCGVPVDLSLLDMPAFIYGSREDHIVPWESAYASTRVLRGPRRFVLGASGHIAGVINPPAKGKRSHWTRSLPGGPGTPGAQAQDVEDGSLDAAGWLQQATERPGSWWPEWTAWLASHAGRKVPAPRTPGNARHQPIEPAPGRYVKRRA